MSTRGRSLLAASLALVALLLAPACASFDQFQSYEHRGQVFKDLVTTLGNQAGGGHGAKT